MQLPTKEQMDARLAEARKRRADEIANPGPVMRHLQQTCSLQSWLARCAKVGIDAIPAMFGPAMKTDQIFSCLDGAQGDKIPDVIAAHEWLKANLGPNMMWRWDCCAPSQIKSEMSDGAMTLPMEPLFDIDDPRFIDILYETGRDTMDFCVRPWVKAVYFDSHPVEFRCFVFLETHGGLSSEDHYEVAVSNYYPQRRLGSYWYDAAVAAGKLALKLATTETFENGFTADFLVDSKCNILFLEGGPGWGFGSHPCCIAPERMRPGRIVLENEWKQNG